MWAEDDLYPGVPCLNSYTEPVNGQIYLMYHGTSRNAAQQIMACGFRLSANGMLGRGVYLSRDLNKASRYPLNLPEHQRVVIRVRVNVGRVKKIQCRRPGMIRGTTLLGALLTVAWCWAAWKKTVFGIQTGFRSLISFTQKCRVAFIKKMHEIDNRNRNDKCTGYFSCF